MTVKMIPVEIWAAGKYAPPPSAWILARWCRDGEIHPEPERVGRAWFVAENAKRMTTAQPVGGGLVAQMRAAG